MTCVHDGYLKGNSEMFTGALFHVGVSHFTRSCSGQQMFILAQFVVLRGDGYVFPGLSKGVVTSARQISPSNPCIPPCPASVFPGCDHIPHVFSHRIRNKCDSAVWDVSNEITLFGNKMQKEVCLDLIHFSFLSGM